MAERRCDTPPKGEATAIASISRLKGGAIPRQKGDATAIALHIQTGRTEAGSHQLSIDQSATNSLLLSCVMHAFFSKLSTVGVHQA